MAQMPSGDAAGDVRVVLVAPDSKEVSRLLQELSYQVASQPLDTSAQEIEAVAAQAKNCLILIDASAPALQDLSSILQSCPHPLPIVVMSSDDSHASTLHAYNDQGAADYLVYPLRRNELAVLWKHVWRAQMAAMKAARVVATPPLAKSAGASSQRDSNSNRSFGASLRPVVRPDGGASSRRHGLPRLEHTRTSAQPASGTAPGSAAPPPEDEQLSDSERSDTDNNGQDAQSGGSQSQSMSAYDLPAPSSAAAPPQLADRTETGPPCVKHEPDSGSQHSNATCQTGGASSLRPPSRMERHPPGAEVPPGKAPLCAGMPRGLLELVARGDARQRENFIAHPGCMSWRTHPALLAAPGAPFSPGGGLSAAALAVPGGRSEGPMAEAVATHMRLCQAALMQQMGAMSRQFAGTPPLPAMPGAPHGPMLPHLIGAGPGVPPGVAVALPLPQQVHPALSVSSAGLEVAPKQQQQQQQQQQQHIRQAATAQSARAAALARFRAKRARRNFDKTVRYESRKRLAQARPRAKGQFVRHETSAPGSSQTSSFGTTPAGLC